MLLRASAGSGKTKRLTQEVFDRILKGGKFISALTFTRAATTEMRSRIMEMIAGKRDLPLLERLRLIMEAGRVGYSTIDSFFYRLIAASGFAPKLADEKAQLQLLREIEILFRDNVMMSGKAGKIIIVARVLRLDIDALWEPLADEQAFERCVLDMPRIADLDDMIKENGKLRNRLKTLGAKAKALSDRLTPQVNKRVVDCLVEYEDFISKKVATHSDLQHYASLGKNIKWDEKPYVELNRIFKDYRKIAEKLSVNKATLRMLAVVFLCDAYVEAADAVKKEKGLIFFPDVRRGLLALDGAASEERPKLMSHYFSLGLDRTEHLLIDEFQDTSKGDIEILLPLIDEILSGRGERGERTFFAVGDWKQMIYGWRGADREAMEYAIGEYISNRIIAESSLEYNFRSTSLLISFFNQLVHNLFDGKEKNETQKPPPEGGTSTCVAEVSVVELEKEGNSEDPFYPKIMEVLKAKKDEYGCSWGDMAVLALTNNHVQKIETEIVKNEIGVSAVKGRQLLSTKDGVAVMLFIAGVLARDDTGFTSTAVNSTLWREVFGNTGAIRAEFTQKFPRPFGFMAVSGVIELLRGKLSSAILDIWQDEAQAFFMEGGADVDDFLLRIFGARFNVRVPEADNSENIKVDTIHGTKGLQFKHVFVYWNEDEKEVPFYLPSEQCHAQFTRKEVDFWAASDAAIAKEIGRNREATLARTRREKANVFYVAATRAIRTLTVLLPKKKNANYEPVHQDVLNTFSQFAPEGLKKETCALPPHRHPKEGKAVPLSYKPEKYDREPEKYAEIDPALISAAIKTGITRGERIHRWLAKVVDQTGLPAAGELNDEEYAAVLRFVARGDVASRMFRPGRLYVEQQISDKNDFGIVDRMIVAENLITIMDYKSGSMRGLKQKYHEQLERYTKIMESLYPGRQVEYFVLPIDI